MELLLITPISRPLHHQLGHHVHVAGQVHHQGHKIVAGGVQAPALLVDVSDEPDVSRPEHVVTDEIEGTAEVGYSEAASEDGVRQHQGSLGCVNGIDCVTQSEH